MRSEMKGMKTKGRQVEPMPHILGLGSFCHCEHMYVFPV